MARSRHPPPQTRGPPARRHQLYRNSQPVLYRPRRRPAGRAVPVRISGVGACHPGRRPGQPRPIAPVPGGESDLYPGHQLPGRPGRPWPPRLCRARRDLRTSRHHPTDRPRAAGDRRFGPLATAGSRRLEPRSVGRCVAPGRDPPAGRAAAPRLRRRPGHPDLHRSDQPRPASPLGLLDLRHLCRRYHHLWRRRWQLSRRADSASVHYPGSRCRRAPPRAGLAEAHLHGGRLDRGQ